MDSASKRFFKAASAGRGGLWVAAGGLLIVLLTLTVAGLRSQVATLGLLVLVLIFYAVARRSNTASARRIHPNLSVVSSVRLPGGGRVHAVEFGGRLIVVGVSGGGICRLGSFAELPASLEATADFAGGKIGSKRPGCGSGVDAPEIGGDGV